MLICFNVSQMKVFKESGNPFFFRISTRGKKQPDRVEIKKRKTPFLYFCKEWHHHSIVQIRLLPRFVSTRLALPQSELNYS